MSKDYDRGETQKFLRAICLIAASIFKLLTRGPRAPNLKIKNFLTGSGLQCLTRFFPDQREQEESRGHREQDLERALHLEGQHPGGRKRDQDPQLVQSLGQRDPGEAGGMPGCQVQDR